MQKIPSDDLNADKSLISLRTKSYKNLEKWRQRIYNECSHDPNNDVKLTASCEKLRFYSI